MRRFAPSILKRHGSKRKLKTSTDSPCPRCSSVEYQRKVKFKFDRQGDSVVVCNVCAPKNVEVPLEVHENDMLITTGTFCALLDWRSENVVVETTHRWHEPTVLRKLRDWGRRLVGSLSVTPGVE